MEALLATLGYAIGFAALAWAVTRRVQSYFDLRKRQRLEAEIRAIADDLTTNRDGHSLRDAVDLLEVEMIQELVVELRKMPAGSRSLQRAIEITGDESDGRAA